MLEQLNQSWNNLLDKLEGWLDNIIVNLPNFILALLIVLVGFYLARYARRYLHKLFRRMNTNMTVSNVLSNIGYAVFVALFIFIAIGVLNLSTVLASLLAGAGVLGLAIGLALQEPLVNMFSGVLLSVRKLYNIGDLVKTNDYFGTIKDITLRSTLLRTTDGLEVIIPNKDVLQNPITNYSNTSERRVAVECGISYGDDLEKVEKVAVNAIKEGCDYDEDREVEFFFTAFGGSSVNFIVRFWLNDPFQGAYLKGQHEAIIALKKAFDANDIMIPFPIRTLDFGIRGGERLNEVLSLEKFAGKEDNGT